MEIKQAIILAGGLGTRLRDIVPELPKCMAPVAGRPFLFYAINYLRSQGIERFIFSVGYKHEPIQAYLESDFPTLDYECSIEEEPLGTGGAILKSSQLTKEENILVANGDTLFKINIAHANRLHLENKADCTLVLKPMRDFSRYAVVGIEEDGRVIQFREKKFYKEGLINGGTYILNVESFQKRDHPEKFSFENDYLEKYFEELRIYGSIQDNYFIDIGIPEDYNKAQSDLQTINPVLTELNGSWTLFIDRDGIINYEKKDDYIRSWSDFKFYENMPQLFNQLSKKFKHIIVVSNQRGVGRGWMTEAALTDIHSNMKKELEEAGGRIDAIYYCSSPDPLHPDRKPNPGMANKAKMDFPAIDFQRSLMIGNKLSDMLFGKNAGMHTVFIASTHPQTPFPHPDIDFRFETLADFVKALPAGRQGL